MNWHGYSAEHNQMTQWGLMRGNTSRTIALGYIVRHHSLPGHLFDRSDHDRHCHSGSDQGQPDQFDKAEELRCWPKLTTKAGQHAPFQRGSAFDRWFDRDPSSR
ncbi:hypothetical protein NQ318_000756 [Aromia moschata]|uniref:Uncharacterized protein n=1 Tax=Aromia moschata TaxID=1265417 RepID=A0AAV8YSV2_9CUCU|nr:hypothetical protein NQ318_000756 [Aromia moschata]